MYYEETLILPVIPPFRLDLTIWALRRREKNSLDQWDGEKYSRVFLIYDNTFQVVVAQKTETELTVKIKSTTEAISRKEPSWSLF